MKIDFTLYPNMGGNLGEKKVAIPDGDTTFWPDGDAMVGNFIYKNGKLVGLVDTKALVVNESKSTTIPYDFVESEFENVREDSVKFNLGERCKNFTLKLIPKYKGCKTIDDIVKIEPNYKTVDIVDGVWSKDLGDLEGGYGMFKNCSNLTIFEADLKSIIEGGSMFHNCANLIKFDSDLSSLVNGRYMFYGCSNLSSFDSDLSSLIDGFLMFYNCKISSFNLNLSSLENGSIMFQYCSNLTSFKSDLSSLIKGDSMFQHCSNLTTFDSKNLKSLSSSGGMFQYCSNLISFTSYLNNLTNANQMFHGCSRLSRFEGNLSSLKSAEWMFYGCNALSDFKCNSLGSLENGYLMFWNCKLTSFDYPDLSSLTNGFCMFQGCSNLTSFKSDLSSLIEGNSMFQYCKLDAPSVKKIIDTINAVESASLGIGMGCNGNTTDKDLFAQEVGYPDMTTLLQALQSKGWTVYAQFNGRPSSNYSLRQPESLPVFVKLVEVAPSEEDDYNHYEYTSPDETKFYNLDWFHETTSSTDDYTQYNSLEEAITTFNIKPIEK